MYVHCTILFGYDQNLCLCSRVCMLYLPVSYQCLLLINLQNCCQTHLRVMLVNTMCSRHHPLVVYEGPTAKVAFVKPHGHLRKIGSMNIQLNQTEYQKISVSKWGQHKYGKSASLIKGTVETSVDRVNRTSTEIQYQTICSFLHDRMTIRYYIQRCERTKISMMLTGLLHCISF